MSRRTLLLAALLALTPALLWGQQSESVVKTEKITSRTLGTDKEYTVYLPAGYETSGKQYPVLYLLHGAWGSHDNWVRMGGARQIADLAIDSGAALPMIIVMPDASGEKPDKTGSRMGYYNRPGWNYEDFFFEEFIPHIEKTYRAQTDKRGRAIAGLSMGGGGAMVYALRHPEMFGSACPLSALMKGIKTGAAALNDPVFGKTIEDNDAVELVRGATEAQVARLRTVRWYVDCGDDDYLYEGNVMMYLAMRRRQIPLQYRMRDGAHDWEYWRSALPSVLQFVSTGFAR